MNKKNEGQHAKRVGRIAVVLFTAWVWLSPVLAGAAEVKERAEAEGKLMFYASFNAADSKTLTDGFKQLYPKMRYFIEARTRRSWREF
jgi:hypothetical protein